MNRTFGRRVARLEQRLASDPGPLIVWRYEGPGSERFPQPTQEQLEKARHVMTLQIVEAKDGRPATPSEIEEMYPGYVDDPR